ncbi:hypothetical protein HA402_004366 [Bradysia odoriphaga]|nr:hypothetical protein HA402_004366 [Bradysia odoriphaga]
MKFFISIIILTIVSFQVSTATAPSRCEGELTKWQERFCYLLKQITALLNENHGIVMRMVSGCLAVFVGEYRLLLDFNPSSAAEACISAQTFTDLAFKEGGRFFEEYDFLKRNYDRLSTLIARELTDFASGSDCDELLNEDKRKIIEFLENFLEENEYVQDIIKLDRLLLEDLGSITESFITNPFVVKCTEADFCELQQIILDDISEYNRIHHKSFSVFNQFRSICDKQISDVSSLILKYCRCR